MAIATTLEPEDLLSQLDGLCSNHSKEREALEEGIQILHRIVEDIAPSWSGSWIGHHADLYYENFRQPPPQHQFDIGWGTMRLAGPWYQVDFEGVQKAIEATKGAPKMEDVWKIVKNQRAALKPLQEEIVISLSQFRGRPGFEAEEKLLDEVEKHEWGISAQDFAKYQMPKTYMTRDQRAAAEGIKAPPHIMYDCNVLAIQSSLKSHDDFCRLARRLLRQVQMKKGVVELGGPPALDGPAPGVLVQICQGFHRAARQLRSRYGNRPTLEVNDEYDVQDLLHAMLRLHFEDVRPEDYTPSYAGGNSRVDFLLKKERVVVEVKRTREGLTDKQLGEELIIDIARYRAHPECKTLVCFVYDPEGRIGNPRGLEADLGALASNDLQVVVFIEPS